MAEIIDETELASLLDAETYKFELPYDAPLGAIIEFLNLLKLQVTIQDKEDPIYSDYLKFIDKYPEYVTLAEKVKLETPKDTSIN